MRICVVVQLIEFHFVADVNVITEKAGDSCDACGFCRFCPLVPCDDRIVPAIDDDR